MTKKIKIISERVNAPFLEIKKDETLEEELMPDEETQEELEEEFSGFIPTGEARDKAAPVLQAGRAEDLDTSLENVPSTPTSARVERNNETKYEEVYNMPDYNAGMEVERPRDREQNVTLMQPKPQQIDDTRKMNVNIWDREMAEPETRHVREDYRIRMRKEKRKEGLPFEQ